MLLVSFKELHFGGLEIAGIKGLVYMSRVHMSSPVKSAQDLLIGEITEQADKMGADAIIGIKFELSNSADDVIVSVYGTAVKLL